MRFITSKYRALLFASAVVVVVGVGSVCWLGCGGDSGTEPGGGGGDDSYEYVTIGGLKWMKKNLNIETAGSWCYGEGGQVRDSGVLKTLSSDEVQANCAKYGRLYTWSAANAACQSAGWRLPDTTDWWHKLGALESDAEAAAKLRSKDGWGWGSFGSRGGTDDFGFSALPGGIRDTSGDFKNVGYSGYYWSSLNGLLNGNDIALGFELNSLVDWAAYDKGYAFSVRCVKN